MLAVGHEAVHWSEVGDPRARDTALMQWAMANGFPVPLSRLQPSRIDAIEDWPWVDQDMLRSSRSRQVCMSCHFLRYHPGPNCIPVLTCHLHQGLIAHGEHLTHRCQGWTEVGGVITGELLPGEPVLLLKHRGELSRGAAIKLWVKSARRAGPLVVPSGELCRHEAFPVDL